MGPPGFTTFQIFDMMRKSLSAGGDVLSLISVVIPVYNGEKYLKESALSVLNQTYENFELLLINNCSTDNTENICRELAGSDGRIRYFYAPDKGVSHARNAGITSAAGDFVFFLDCDDALEKDALESLAVYAGDPEIQVITGLVKHVTVRGKKIKTTYDLSLDSDLTIEKKDIPRVFLESGYALYQVSKLYDLRFLKKHGILFDTDISYGEDALFNLECFRRADKIVMLNQYTCIYYTRLDENHSATVKYRPSLAAEKRYVSGKIIHFLADGGTWGDAEKRRYYVYYLNDVYAMVKNIQKAPGAAYKSCRDEILRQITGDEVCQMLTYIDKSRLSALKRVFLLFVEKRWVFMLYLAGKF